MQAADRPRTKIVATLGPASREPETIGRLIDAGMNVARLNFSHGSHEEHSRTIADVRTIADQRGVAVTILQDLQGPKVRLGRFVVAGAPPAVAATGTRLTLLPAAEYHGQPDTVPIDYADLASELAPGATILLDDGRIELAVEATAGTAVHARVVDGGPLRDRIGVIVPSAEFSIPSLTDKDLRDVEWGVAHAVDWIALSFVRRAADVRALRAQLAQRGAAIPLLAKIEKRQAVEHLDEILDEVQGLMVARGDLGLEVRPEKVPVLQKQIIRACNRRGMPVITATQMLESMIVEPRPTRAEASDVANAIADGSDCVMLSGESSIGAHPVRAVEMMARIAREVEPTLHFTEHPPLSNDATNAIAQAMRAIDRTVPLRCIAAFSTSGYTGRLVSAQRPRAPVVVLTPAPQTVHALNLMWGTTPLLTTRPIATFEELIAGCEQQLVGRRLATPGDQVLIVAGLPMSQAGGTNLLKIHTVGDHHKVTKTQRPPS